MMSDLNRKLVNQGMFIYRSVNSFSIEVYDVKTNIKVCEMSESEIPDDTSLLVNNLTKLRDDKVTYVGPYLYPTITSW